MSKEEQTIKLLNYLKTRSAVATASADNSNYECCSITIEQAELMIPILEEYVKEKYGF